MRYYKLLSGGKIVDVVENPIWVKQDVKGRIIRCEAKEALGIVSSDMSSTFHIYGTKEFENRNYDEISVADITLEEYEELKVLLNLGATLPDEGNPEWYEEETEPDESVQNETLTEVKTRCLAQLSDDCRQTIYRGVDVELSDGTIRHFALEIEDQLNLLTLSTMIASGETKIPYHASGELCTYFSSEDISTIMHVATEYKTYHTTYYNSLKNWIMSMESIADVGAVKYGDTVPSEYCSDILIGITSDMG